jgi:hypothetical protein
MIPIVAIMGAFSYKIVQTIVAAKERRMELQIRLKQAGIVQSDDAATRSLREEFTQYKYSSTQYDLSVENTLQRIEQRLAHIEQRTLAAPAVAAPPAQEEIKQIVGSRD